jgi:hypothetical protein
MAVGEIDRKADYFSARDFSAWLFGRRQAKKSGAKNRKEVPAGNSTRASLIEEPNLPAFATTTVQPVIP